MKKVKFDFDATKRNIFVNQNAAVPVGAPVDQSGAVANNGNAIGIVIGAKKQVISGRFVKNLVVMVAGYCDIIDAQEIWGDEYSAEAKRAMSDIIFCDDHKIGGGGGWPADLPKPSVGGYGYTEQGEQTVITWDGDTEGRDSFTLDFGLGEVPYYKASEKSDNYTDSAVVGFNDADEREAVKSDGNGAFMYWDGESILVVVADGGDFSLYNGVITGDAPSAGVYFMNFAQAEVVVSSLTYGTPDTVHKIDEKYLPASGGGAMVVTVDYGQSGLTADKTYEEIWEAASNGVPVLAVVRFNGRAANVLTMQQATPIDGSGVTHFGPGWVDNGTIKSILMVDSWDRWEIGSPD